MAGSRSLIPTERIERSILLIRGQKVNIEIMRSFVRLRQMLASQADLARKLQALERKYDSQFKVVFDAIRQLMAPPRRVGFGTRK